MCLPLGIAEKVLLPEEWLPLAAAHEARVDPWVTPRLVRRAAGQKHPVDDFLFDYYPYRPGQLRLWHPGLGAVLDGSRRELAPYLASPDYEQLESGVSASLARLERHRERLDWAHRVVAATAAREPRFGCFALHEWAMVYRLEPDEVRHSSWPLRLAPDEIADVVHEQGLHCTHFDAFRFYSPAAEPLNDTRLTRAGAPAHEQPGCLHAGMDLYKWAYLFAPFTASELVADAFALARDIRALDMRAAPYDLADLGVEPLRIEAPEGRAEFVREQRAAAERAAALRARVLAALTSLRTALGTA